MDNLIFNYRSWIDECEPDLLKGFFAKALQEAGYTILNHMEHHFSPLGYTSLWLLAESHFAIHTYPEFNKSYIELTGCNKEMNNVFISIVEKEFENSALKAQAMQID